MSKVEEIKESAEQNVSELAGTEVGAVIIPMKELLKQSDLFLD
jgi:hypothetical protein